MRVTSNKRDAFFIMTYENFAHDCIVHSSIIRVAIVASFLMLTIDQLIHDCFNNEFDDFEFHSSNDFNDFIDFVYTNYVH